MYKVGVVEESSGTQCQEQQEITLTTRVTSSPSSNPVPGRHIYYFLNKHFVKKEVIRS